MRELFDEVYGQSQLDPQEAVRRSTRGPQRKRFYKTVGLSETPDGFAIMLDDKTVRTPSRHPLVIPTARHCRGRWSRNGMRSRMSSTPRACR